MPKRPTELFLKKLVLQAIEDIKSELREMNRPESFDYLERVEKSLKQ